MLEKDWNKAAIVTSPYHTKRTMILFKYFGKDMIFSVIPSNYPPYLNLISRLKDVFYEYVNIIIWYCFSRFFVNG
ncbi:MAG: YdcF family protein, partial [Caldilineales bacterium]|nr:YdcF family protein [Caldilineales bacterium]